MIECILLMCLFWFCLKGEDGLEGFLFVLFILLLVECVVGGLFWFLVVCVMDECLGVEGNVIVSF